MEEVDKIIIQSLASIECNISPDVTSIGQLDQDLLIEIIAKLLNRINLSLGNNVETLPTKLPPSTAVKFRICTKFANVCQALGYKNEVGYQTFLYSNESETRKLLMFLVEKLNKETSSSNEDNKAEINTKNSKNLDSLISEKTGKLLQKFWIPPYLKQNGLRQDENDQFFKEGCRFITRFNAINLDIPFSLISSKPKFQKNFQEYFNNNLKYANQQSSKANFLASLIQSNTFEYLKENSILKSDPDSNKNESKKNLKNERLNELKNVIRTSLKNTLDLLKEQNSKSLITESDLNEIETQSSGNNLKNLFVKGSRFQHAEKLQFTNQETDKNVSVMSNNTEEKKNEEISNLKQKLQNINDNLEKVEADIESLKNETMLNLENRIGEQEKLNKDLLDRIKLKNKTVNLINDAPMNILKLKEEINSHEKKMNNLKEQWNEHKQPLERQRDELRKEILNQKEQIKQKIEETKQIRSLINDLNSELTQKENLVMELNKEMDTLSKSESSKNTNRQFFTKRILEICSNIDKQRNEIDKILIETKSIQKEINQLSGKLERIFNSTDELLYKDAKQSEMNKKIYKLFININSEYETMLEYLEQTSQLDRECRELEDQVNLESQNKFDDNTEKVINDLKQVKQENEQLISKIKAK